VTVYIECDRCRMRIEEFRVDSDRRPGFVVRIQQSKLVGVDLDPSYDLCRSCAESLKRWLADPPPRAA
jgi:hypothetical protein